LGGLTVRAWSLIWRPLRRNQTSYWQIELMLPWPMLRINCSLAMCTELTDWSLDQLLNNSRIEAVGVSTDDEEIYAHTRAKNTVDFGRRPAELCTDTAPKWPVWQHSRAAVEEKLVKFRSLLTLMAPRRKSGKIQFLTETRCNGFTGWTLDGAVIGADDNRLF
jgi:hypothetical protein